MNLGLSLHSALAMSPAGLPLGLVKAIEAAPPAGQEPVAWCLLTTIQAEDEVTALLMLDYDRRR